MYMYVYVYIYIYMCVCGILDIPCQISADSGLLKGGARFQVGHRKEDVQHQDDAALPRAGALGKVWSWW